MSTLLKTISFQLTRSSVNDAIKEINDVKKQLEECMRELIMYLMSYGQYVAKVQLIAMDAIFTGELLENGIHGAYFEHERCGVVYTDKWYAVYVEFGTGIVGEDAPHHPLEGEFGWKHDVNNHGEYGWWYPAPFGWYIPSQGRHAGESMAWTMGMRARPFMYKTLRELETIAEKEGIKFFNFR